jgi:hypothetical protein
MSEDQKGHQVKRKQLKDALAQRQMDPVQQVPDYSGYSESGIDGILTPSMVSDFSVDGSASPHSSPGMLDLAYHQAAPSLPGMFQAAPVDLEGLSLFNVGFSQQESPFDWGQYAYPVSGLSAPEQTVENDPLASLQMNGLDASEHFGGGNQESLSGLNSPATEWIYGNELTDDIIAMMQKMQVRLHQHRIHA